MCVLVLKSARSAGGFQPGNTQLVLNWGPTSPQQQQWNVNTRFKSENWKSYQHQVPWGSQLIAFQLVQIHLNHLVCVSELSSCQSLFYNPNKKHDLILSSFKQVLTDIGQLFVSQSTDKTGVCYTKSTRHEKKSPLQEKTYEIWPKGANAALMSSVEISGLRSPTNTWKWSRAKEKTKEVTTKKCGLDKLENK